MLLYLILSQTLNLSTYFLNAIYFPGLHLSPPYKILKQRDLPIILKISQILCSVNIYFLYL